MLYIYSKYLIYLNLFSNFHYNISRVQLNKEDMKIRNSVRKTGKRPQNNDKDDNQQQPKPEKHASINYNQKSQELKKSQEIAFFNLIVGRRPEQPTSQTTSIFNKQGVNRYAEKNEQQKDVETKARFQQKATNSTEMVEKKVVKNDRINVYTDLFDNNHEQNSLVHAFREASQKQQQKYVENKPDPQFVFSKKFLSVVPQKSSSEEDGMGPGPKLFYDLSENSRINPASRGSVIKQEKKGPQQNLSYKFNVTNLESLNTPAQKNQFHPFFAQQYSQKNLFNTSRPANRPSTNLSRVLEQSCSSSSPNQSLFQSEKTQTPQLFPAFGPNQQKKSNSILKPGGILFPNLQTGQGLQSKIDIPLKQYEKQKMNFQKNPLLQSTNPSLPVFSATAIASFANSPGSIFGGSSTTPDTPKFSTQINKQIPEFQRSLIEKAFIQLYNKSQKQHTQPSKYVHSNQMTFPSFIPIVNEPNYFVNVESQQIQQQERARYHQQIDWLNYVVNQVRTRYESNLENECQRAKSQFKCLKTDLGIQMRIQDKMNELFFMLEQQALLKQTEILRLQKQNSRLQQSLDFLIPKLDELQIQNEKKQKMKSPNILQQIQELEKLVKEIQWIICTKPQSIQRREQKLKPEPTEMTIRINYIYEMIANAEDVLFRLARTHIL